MTRETSFYQEHLDRVSRSFAFCIQKLESPFREWISLSYLLCRVLDTVEDSSWRSKRLQESQYLGFECFVRERPAREEVADWLERFPAEIPPGEKLLLGDTYALFHELHDLPAAQRKAIQSGISVMRTGMQRYSSRAVEGTSKLLDLGEVNRYCYFVAGVVGQLASELFQLYRPDFRPGADFKKNALHFGLFLQKINLLKDQSTDQREGRYFVPDRALLLSSLRTHAEGALRYLMELPSEEKGYRTFCGWSLFLGAASLPWIEQGVALGDSIKIPRSVTQKLLAAIEAIIQDNGQLERHFEEYAAFLPRLKTIESISRPSGEDLSWFYLLTRSRLDPSHMAELGMV